MLKLITDRVAIIPIDDPDKIGSLWVPEMAKERCDQGIVKYIGPDCKYAKVGMYVVFSGYTGTLIKIEDEGNDRLIILPEDFCSCELTDIPTTPVKNLYFRTRPAHDEQYKELYSIIRDILPGLDESQYDSVATKLVYSGVCGPKTMPFMEATYEHGMEMLVQAIEDAEWHKDINVVTPRPSLADYDALKAGTGTIST